MQTILEGVQQHWQDLRGRTYDLMDVLSDADLKARLPFQESQDVFYQFRCMLGTQESWAPVLLEGRMRGWDCSLQPVEPGEAVPMGRIREAMMKADGQLHSTFEQVEWLKVFSNGTSPLMGYLRLAEHEAHHHGQLINFIYACGFPIPESWADSWALSRNVDGTV